MTVAAGAGSMTGGAATAGAGDPLVPAGGEFMVTVGLAGVCGGFAAAGGESSGVTMRGNGIGPGGIGS